MTAVAPLRELPELPQPRRERPPLQRRTGPRTVNGSVRTLPVAVPGSASGEPIVRPHLEVVPRRRRAVGIIVACCIVLFGLLLGAVAFQTRLAQNQLALDKTERAVRDARARYDILRRQRAQLRAPERLAVEATRLGMAPAQNGEFLLVDPALAATVAAAASGLPDDVSITPESSLDQYGHIKAVTEDAP